MTDAIRYLMVLTGFAFWAACLGFFLIGCYACARQALDDRAIRKAEGEDADLAAQYDRDRGYDLPVEQRPGLSGVGEVWHRRYEVER